MKNVIFLCFLILFFNSSKAQQNTISEDDERIHAFVQERANLQGISSEDFKKTLMGDMKSKWNLSFSEVILKFVVEKDGTISNLKVVSEEWKTTDNELNELSKLISDKGKWEPAVHGGFKVRSNYTIRMLFQQ